MRTELSAMSQPTRARQQQKSFPFKVKTLCKGKKANRSAIVHSALDSMNGKTRTKDQKSNSITFFELNSSIQRRTLRGLDEIGR
jgi:hypothetical protein